MILHDIIVDNAVAHHASATTTVDQFPPQDGCSIILQMGGSMIADLSLVLGTFQMNRMQLATDNHHRNPL